MYEYDDVISNLRSINQNEKHELPRVFQLFLLCVLYVRAFIIPVDTSFLSSHQLTEYARYFFSTELLMQEISFCFSSFGRSAGTEMRPSFTGRNWVQTWEL